MQIEPTARAARSEVSITRSGTHTPFEITDTRAGGFSESVHAVIDARYLALFEEISPQPEPSIGRASADGSKVDMTFEPPAGETLHVDLSRRAHPSARFRHRAHVPRSHPRRPARTRRAHVVHHRGRAAPGCARPRGLT
jgi:hypothetical protein